MEREKFWKEYADKIKVANKQQNTEVIHLN